MPQTTPGRAAGGRPRAATPGCRVCKLEPDLLHRLEDRLRIGAKAKTLSSALTELGALLTPDQIISHRNGCMVHPQPVSKYEESPPAGYGDRILLPVGWMPNRNLQERFGDLPKDLWLLDPQGNRSIEPFTLLMTAPKSGPGALPGEMFKLGKDGYQRYRPPTARLMAIARALLWLADSYDATVSDTAAGMP